MPSHRSLVSSDPPARLEVRLLGAVEVILDGHHLRALNSLRLQRFLALITLRSDLLHRSRLAFELWPDSNERQARTNLRKLLHEFRHALPDAGEFIQIDNEILKVHQDADAAVKKNERHVIYAYAAMWIIAALFLVYLLFRQQSLKRDIASLRKDLEEAEKK